jgi:hypothetical protein
MIFDKNRLDVDIAAASLIAKMSRLPEHGLPSDTGTRARLQLLKKRLDEHLNQIETPRRNRREKKKSRRRKLLVLK